MSESIVGKKKLSVIGWTDYDDEYFDSCDITDEVFEAVVEEVRKEGYLFGGDSHEDYTACCPVLSNGCCARFSCRGWGEVIATAYEQRGENGKLDIMCGYMDEMITPSAIRRPPAHINYLRIEDCSKTYNLNVSNSQYDNYWFKKFEARVADEEFADVTEGDLLDMMVHEVLENGFELPDHMGTYKVKEIFRGQSFEEVLEQARDGYTVTSEYLGYPDGLSEEQLLEQLYKDYPREDVQKKGAILFRLVPQR